MLAPFRSRGITPYAVGIASVVAASVLRFLLDPVLGEHLSFSFHFLAVSLAAWIGGVGPAVVTALLSAIVGNFFFTDPTWSLAISGYEEFVNLIIFLLVSLVIGLLSEASLRALDRAKQAEREKDDFLAVLAHEMRSPISVIYYANSLNRVAGDDQSGDQLDVIDRQVKHLNTMIEDLLDVSRIARGKIKLDKKEVEAASIVDGAVERARPVIESHRHSLHVDIQTAPIMLLADPARMEQVIANLLTNAAKYTPDGGRIELGVEPVGDTVSISVRDNGIGIPKDVLPHVFDLFMQADAASERAGGGLGIGLAVVQKIVEMHGGSVLAASAGPNRGSEFVITLPLHLPPTRRDALVAATAIAPHVPH